MNWTNWAIESLPHLEQGPLYDRYDKTRENDDPVNDPVLQTGVEIMKCPTDSAAQGVGPVRDYARGSYLAVAGALFRKNGSSGPWIPWSMYPGPGAGDMVIQGVSRHCRGLLHVTGAAGLRAEKIKDVTDGLSNTLMIGEYHATGDRPMYVHWGSTYRFMNKRGLHGNAWLRQPDRELCKANVSYEKRDRWVCDNLFGAAHSGQGANWAKADGAVTFLANDIDGAVYEAMSTIAGEDNPGQTLCGGG